MFDFVTNKVVDAVLSTIFVVVTFSFGLAIASGVTGKEYKVTQLPGVFQAVNIIKHAGRELGAKIEAWTRPNAEI